MRSILYSPGQTATLTLTCLDGYGSLADAAVLPNVKAIYFPNSTLAVGFPAAMTKLSTGIYTYKFKLPIGASAVGTYIAVMEFTMDGTLLRNETIDLLVQVPFGNFSITGS